MKAMVTRTITAVQHSMMKYTVDLLEDELVLLRLRNSKGCAAAPIERTATRLRRILNGYRRE
jgi:hypothetical protein